jgi:DNA-directed RNA polymerase subunit RPC12/RpoP
MDIKKCTKCKQEQQKNLNYFPPHNKTKDGLDSWCRKCRSTYRNEIRRGNYRHLITDEQLKHNLQTIKHCQVCGQEELLVVDHDHKNEKYRGLLCNHCNRGLGHFRDNPEILQKAIDYLNK